MRLKLICAKKTLLLILSVVTATIINGCFEDRETLFEHQQLEWEPPNPATNELNMTVILDSGQTENETVTLRIRYAGEHLSNNITGVFEVDSDAEENVHYSISDYTVTISANSSFSEEIEIEILSENIADNENFDLLLTITDQSDVPPMENYKTFVLSIEKDAE